MSDNRIVHPVKFGPDRNVNCNNLLSVDTVAVGHGSQGIMAELSFSSFEGLEQLQIFIIIAKMVAQIGLD